MDFDMSKENIQPLRSGRNAEYLSIALSAENEEAILKELEQQRLNHETRIQNYVGSDPLEAWYDYISWIEQTYPKSGKESHLDKVLTQCITTFENAEQYLQDRRMIKLYIKFIDSQPNPQDLYQELYNQGIGTMVADLYMAWAYYYDAVDNFKKAEEIYQKGLQAGAQPRDDLEHAHKQFGFSMSQRILYKDEPNNQSLFKSSLNEQRAVLTSLKAHKKTFVGTSRTGLSIKSEKPGAIFQDQNSSKAGNSHIKVLEDAETKNNVLPEALNEPHGSIIDSIRLRENLLEPGPWDKAKVRSKFTAATVPDVNQLGFKILEDETSSIPCLVSTFNLGFKRPQNFVAKNSKILGDTTNFPLVIPEPIDPKGIPMYAKFHCYPTTDKEFSPEEYRAFNWFQKNQIKTEKMMNYEKFWANSVECGIRIPPNFVKQNKSQTKMDYVIPMQENGEKGFTVPYEKMIIKEGGEIRDKSHEEIMAEKWKLKPKKVQRQTIYMDLTMAQNMSMEVDEDEKMISTPEPKSYIKPDTLNPSFHDQSLMKDVFAIPAQPQPIFRQNQSIVQPAKEEFKESPPSLYGPNDSMCTINFNKCLGKTAASTPIKTVKKIVALDTKKIQEPETPPAAPTKTVVDLGNTLVKQLSTIMETTESTSSTGISTKENVFSSPVEEPVHDENPVPQTFSIFEDKTENMRAMSLKMPVLKDEIYQDSVKKSEISSAGGIFKENISSFPIPEQNNENIAPQTFSIFEDQTENMRAVSMKIPTIPDDLSIFHKKSPKFEEEIKIPNESVKKMFVKPDSPKHVGYESICEPFENISIKRTSDGFYDSFCKSPPNVLACDKINSMRVDNSPFSSISDKAKAEKEPISSQISTKNKMTGDFLDLFAKTPEKNSSMFSFNVDSKANKTKNFEMEKTEELLKSPKDQYRSLEVNSPKKSDDFPLFGGKNELSNENRDSSSNKKPLFAEDDNLNTINFAVHLGEAQNSTLIEPNLPPGMGKIVSLFPSEPQKSIREEQKTQKESFNPVEAANTDLGMSIYVPAVSKNFEFSSENWEDVTEEPLHEPERFYMTLVEGQNIDSSMMLHQQLNEEIFNPFDKHLRAALLENIDIISYIQELPTCTLKNKIQQVMKGKTIEIGNEAFDVIKVIGKGAFGVVFTGKHKRTGQIMALKQERPANLWEYYICLEIKSRIVNPNILCGFMNVAYSLIGTNASILVSSFSPSGTLIDVCNKYKKATNRNLDEYVVMSLTSQILDLVDHLHSVGIIHADIKPDNFLLMSKINSNDMSRPVVQLIDFGLSIDMQLLQNMHPCKDIVFKLIAEEDPCIEMRENKPWTYQVDLFGVAGTAHAMLLGRYMEVVQKLMKWEIKVKLPRYFQKDIWDRFFDKLLNVRSCKEMPNLQELRALFKEELLSKDRIFREKASEFNNVIFS
ncbi:probable inactive serine/threonine-protein kinase bub1 [Culicoides brevitarsis]|uniref:probable inactive serine/threonine-protein kinase bub1 n=1 Tax=Culicoides brevitarsis TaxID=469753 RepID=UPI00307B51FA